MTDPILPPPVPVPDPDTEPYWAGLKNGKLTLCRCDDTGKWIHPPLERSRFTGGPVHFEQVSRQRFDLGQYHIRALADVEGLLAPGDGHRGEITQRDVHARGADIDAENEARPGIE